MKLDSFLCKEFFARHGATFVKLTALTQRQPLFEAWEDLCRSVGESSCER